VQSHYELIAVDPTALKVVTRYRLSGCKHPHGLRIANGISIGYVACDENDRLLAVDLTSGRITADLPICHDPDVLAADPDSKRLYVACESGFLSVIDTRDAPKPVKLGDVEVGAHAHSVAVDPVTHHLFVPLRDLGGKAVMRILAPR
jgi:DNA-binding beta-propeller fold protein YncE